MSEYYLVCNVTKCRKELKTQAWVTCCSHVFCLEDGQICVDNEKCPACNTTFSKRYDVVLVDLNPSEQHKTMLLAGLSPEKILDIANRALVFWTYQTYQEKIIRDSAIKSAKQHAAELSDYCESLSAKYKVDIHGKEREIQNLRKEIEERDKKIEDLVGQLAEKARYTKNLQSQYNSLKITLSSYTQPQTIPEPQRRAERMEYDMRSTDNPKSCASGRSCNHSSFYSRNKLSDERSADFVFNPVTTVKNSPFNLFN